MESPSRTTAEGAFEVATWLLTWNPKRWDWDALEDEAREVREEGFMRGNWSCGGTRRIERGDRFFLLRQGLEPRGLMASGWVEGEPRKGSHWDRRRRERGKDALYVDVRFDVLEISPVIPRQALDKPPLDRVNWRSQSSGILIEPEAAEKLEAMWAKATGIELAEAPEEVSIPGLYPEGSTQRVAVNVFERNPRARARCIARYGTRCFVCEFSFEERYGAEGRGFIHVHHLRPLSEIGEEYRVDPIKDLRPVCANCHAMIHRRRTPYSIEKVRAMLRKG